MMKYFFNKTGDYIGGFDEGSMGLVPKDAVEVPEPPTHGLDKLIDGIIVSYVEPVNVLDIVATTFNSLPPEKQVEVLQTAKDIFNI